MNFVKKKFYNNFLPLIGRFFVKKNKKVNVIYYHDVVLDRGNSYLSINYASFEKQMRYLAAEGYETMRYQDLNKSIDDAFNSKKVLIQFDDGFKSNYTMIFKLMKDLGLCYNINLAISKIGTDPDYLTWDEIEIMKRSGFVGFGAHTYSHPDMSDINKIDITKEFNYADRIFEEKLGYKPSDFCYPLGAYSDESNQFITCHYEYERIYTSDCLYSYYLNDKVIMGRNGISNEDSFKVFKYKVKGYYNIWNTIFKR